MNYMETLGARAKTASYSYAGAGTKEKDAALAAIASALEAQKARIFEANAKDMAAAQENGMSASMQDRLRLDDARIAGIAGGVRQVMALPDPVGEELGGWLRPNGLRIRPARWTPRCSA